VETDRMKRRHAFQFSTVAVAAALAGCATTSPEVRTVSIQRTAFGVPQISAPAL
jgi:hypothetical protein